MEITTSISSNDFNDFIRCLTNMKEVCNDADIRNGMLRQRTNNHTAVFEIDLTSIFEDAEVTIALTNLKQKLELLKTFQGQDVELEIVTPDDGTVGYYLFKDEHSSIRFVNPTLEFMDNKFMDEDELQSIFPYSEDNMMFTEDMGQVITDRIRIVSTQFNIETVRVSFDGESASISAQTPSKDQYANFSTEQIMLNEEMEKSSTNVSGVAFSMDHDNMIKYEMFKDPNQNVALNKFTTTIGSIDVTVFSRSQIIDAD